MAQSLDGTQVPIVSSRVNPIHLAVNMDTRLLRGLFVFPLLSIMAMFGKTTSGFSMPSFPLSLNMKRGERGGGGGREGEEGEKGGKEDEWATPAWKTTAINSLADRGHLQLDIVYVSYDHTIPIQFILLQHPCSITALFIPIFARSSLYGIQSRVVAAVFDKPMPKSEETVQTKATLWMKFINMNPVPQYQIQKLKRTRNSRL